MIAKLLGAVLLIAAGLLLETATGQEREGAPRFQSAGQSRSPQTLESVAAHIRAEPLLADRSVLAVAATDVGHWRLVNRSGEPFTAASPLELARALRTLAPESDGHPERLVLTLTDDTVFRFAAQIPQLPEMATLRLLHGGSPLALKQRGDGAARTLYAEIRPRQFVEVADRSLFDEAVWQLRRPIERPHLRTLALEPGGPTGIPRQPRPDPATRRAATDSIDPGHLSQALGSLGGQVVLVFGRIDGGRLVFKPSSGPDGSLALADLAGAAAAADVNLLVLASSSARQPGTRNWLWQRIEPSNIARAAERTSLGDFLDALAGEPPMLVIRASRRGPDRTDLEIRPAREIGQGAIDTIADAVTGTWTDIVSETAGRVAVTGFGASMLSAGRQAELDRRFVPGIPSLIQLAYVAVLAAGLLALPTLVAWWRRLWPPETPAEYGHRAGYLLARGARGVIFALLYLPLAAIPAFAASLTGWMRTLIGMAYGLLRRQLKPE